MNYKLNQIAEFEKRKIEIEFINEKNYISTENMLPNKGGISTATTIPTQSKVSFFEEGNILISNIRPYFKKIYYPKFKGGCSNDVLNIKIKNIEIINPKYLYYYLFNDNFFEYIMSGVKGTKMPRGDKEQIMNYDIRTPSIDVQNRIIHILDCLENKIELNNQTNDNLLYNVA